MEEVTIDIVKENHMLSKHKRTWEMLASFFKKNLNQYSIN